MSKSVGLVTGKPAVIKPSLCFEFSGIVQVNFLTTIKYTQVSNLINKGKSKKTITYAALKVRLSVHLN